MIAVISDVHANADALGRVLADVRKADPDNTICLGDLVGYHTLVHETLAMLRDAKIPSVHGNHDLMVVGGIDAESCRGRVAQAVHWTRSAITVEEHRYLASLPGAYRLRHDLLFVHSCLGDPVRRLRSPHDYLQQYRLLRHFDPALRICFTGHTHVARIVEITGDESVRLRKEDQVDLQNDCFYFVDPGSVGHPRGEDRRATYVLYDPAADRVTLRRVAYKPNRVLREDVKHGLPAIELVNGAFLPGARAAVRALAERFASMGR